MPPKRRNNKNDIICYECGERIGIRVKPVYLKVPLGIGINQPFHKDCANERLRNRNNNKLRIWEGPFS